MDNNKLESIIFDLKETIKEQRAEIGRLIGDVAYWERKYCIAVKDTAKEICDDLRNIFIEQSSYGSDANQHIGYYDYEVKMGLVIDQIE